MTILIKQARIVDPSSPFNDQLTDILLDNGTIRKIAGNITEKADQIIQHDNLHVSAGWMDIFSDFGDPGYEFKETLESGASAAAAGGYTDVCVIPNTNPCIHNKSGVEYLLQKSRTLPVSIHPLGAVTRNTEGKELAEMYDMKASGAIAFTDGINGIQSAGLLIKALQYIKSFSGTIIQVPDDKTVQPQGLMNEGIVSTQLGLPGRPSISEELMVVRDVALNEYAKSSIHFTGISSSASLQHINDAKAKGLNVSCSVTPHHLLFTEEDLVDYNTNLKVNPPLRGTKDRDQLRKALLNGEIDCVASHHLPQELDSKMIEFEYAKNGMTALETTYSVLNMLKGITQQQIISLLSVNPRKLFGLPPVEIKEGAVAVLTLFNPDHSWIVSNQTLASRSKNTPLLGKELRGKAIGIINGTKNSLAVFNS